MSRDFWISFLEFSNNALIVTIVMGAGSILIYNLSRNLWDRVTRANSILLTCITIVSIMDGLIALDPKSDTVEIWLRLQWVGIAFVPAAIFHLADALLTTTGLVSRGRRRNVRRALYVLSAVIMLLATLSDLFIHDFTARPIPYMRVGPLFPVYAAYFITSAVVAYWLVWRARARCRTAKTYQRMDIILKVFLTPGIGLFPYSLLFDMVNRGHNFDVLIFRSASNLANTIVIVMLFSLAYPLAFFGTSKPDRVVKAEILQFSLRGTFTALVLLGVMLSTLRVSEILGLKSEDFVIVAVMGTVVLLQWLITVSLPLLEKWFVFTRNNIEGHKLRQISQRLLTRADIKQLEEAILAAACDLLRVDTAFLLTNTPEGLTIEHSVGSISAERAVESIQKSSSQNGRNSEHFYAYDDVIIGDDFWVFPLYANGDDSPLLGYMGIQARKMPPELSDGEKELEMELFHMLMDRAARLLADAQLQSQVFDVLDALMMQMDSLRLEGRVDKFGQIYQQPPTQQPQNLTEWAEWVHGALKDLWGGPKLADSELLQLNIVQQELEKNGSSPTRALQTILTRVIESLKPEGERSLLSNDWVLYNILEMRFVQGKKVGDVAPQLAMSEPNFYRKQKSAIEEVARQLWEMEKSYLETHQKNGNS